MSCELFHLSNQGEFSRVDLHGLFGAGRFTQAEQDADPAKPLTRLVKDVLRVGKWKVGKEADGRPKLFDFTAEFLARLAQRFEEAKGRGVAFNLCNTHGKNGEVRPEDLIAVLDELKFDGKTLWASVYVTPEQAIYLSNPTRKVSVGINHDWVDGQGNLYDVQLVHVAVVDNPVVSGQGEFIRLANEQEVGMDFAALIEALNGLLGKFGMGKLPEDVDENSLIAVLKTLGGGHEEEKAEGGVQMSNAAQEAEAVKGVMQLVNEQNGVIAELKNELAVMKKEAAKGAFEMRLDNLARGGNITAGIRKTFLAIGEKGGWELSLLDGLEGENMAPSAKVAKQLATEGSPAVEGITKEMSDEEVKKLAAVLTGVR
jgi:hypothetical protein